MICGIKLRADNKIGMCRKHRSLSDSRKSYIKIYQGENAVNIKEYKKQYGIDNKEIINQNYYTKLKTNIGARLIHNLRCRLYRVLKQKKTFSFSKSIGCSVADLRAHLEAKFSPGMTWENYGKWNIDHIYPLSKAKNQEHLKTLNHYTNLQPLWQPVNLKKGNRI